jgi:hypothetical protein
VLHSGKPEFPKELLYEVNNQLEIVMAAAEVLSLQYSDSATKECCAQTQSSIVRTSKILKAHFKGSDIHFNRRWAPFPADTPAVIGRA